jgi:hypothetical protein
LSPAEELLNKCKIVKSEGERLDKINSDLVAEARKLQRIWIIGEMSELKSEGKISKVDWEVFASYTDPGDGLPKLPFGEIESLMKRVVNAGYIRPYLPENVVALGTQAARNESRSDYLINYPECLSDVEYDIVKLVASLPPTKGAWGNKVENPVDLIP